MRGADRRTATGGDLLSQRCKPRENDAAGGMHHARPVRHDEKRAFLLLTRDARGSFALGLGLPEVRGSIDSSDYKNYIFGLLFLKRLSDRFEEEYPRAGAGHR